MMYGHGYGMGFGGGFNIVGIIMQVIIILVVAFFFYLLVKGLMTKRPSEDHDEIKILKERYVRDEISEDEYLKKMAILKKDK